MEEIWIDGKGAKMEPQGDRELSGRMDRSKTGMEELQQRGGVHHTPFFFTKPPQLFPPRFLARGLVA